MEFVCHLAGLLSRVSECGGNESRQYEARQSGEDVGWPPAVTEDIGRGDVNTKDKGKSVAVVNTPAEHTICNSSVRGGEHLSNEGAANRSEHGNVKLWQL